MSEKSVAIHLPAKLEQDDYPSGKDRLIVNVDYITKNTYLKYNDDADIEIDTEATLQLRDFLNREFPA